MACTRVFSREPRVRSSLQALFQETHVATHDSSEQRSRRKLHSARSRKPRPYRLPGRSASSLRSDSPLHEALHRALESRVNDLGTALETLRITRCNVLEEWVEGWRDIVDDVEWDEDEGGLAQTDEDENEDEDDPYGYEGYYDYDDYSEDFNSDDEYHMMGLF